MSNESFSMEVVNVSYDDETELDLVICVDLKGDDLYGSTGLYDLRYEDGLWSLYTVYGEIPEEHALTAFDNNVSVEKDVFPAAEKVLKGDLYRALKDFQDSFIECAYWLPMCTEEQETSDSVDVSDLSDDDTRRMCMECADFFFNNFSNMQLSGGTYSQHGHDFFLTRNGHGAGFWDRGYREDIAQLLTNASHMYGACGIVVNSATGESFYSNF